MKEIDKIPEKDRPDIKKINKSLRAKISALYKEIEPSTKNS